MVAKALKRPVYVAAECYKFARLFPLQQSGNILRLSLHSVLFLSLYDHGLAKRNRFLGLSSASMR